MRVTSGIMFRSTLRDLNDIDAENARLLSQAGTGLKLNRPSDDPMGAVRQLRLRTDLSRQNSTLANVEVAQDEVSASELAISDGIDIFQRAKELALEGATGARSNEDLKAIAAEADQLLTDLLSVGNRKVNGRFIFAGTATTTQPFSFTGSPPSAVTYAGNSGVRTVSPEAGVQVSLNIPGDQAFLTGANTFQSLIDLRDAAEAGDVEALANSVAGELDAAFDKLVDQRTRYGAVSGGLERSANAISARVLSTRGLLSKVEDADLVQTLVDLQNAENRRTAALQAAARVIPPSLLDYLA